MECLINGSTSDNWRFLVAGVVVPCIGFYISWHLGSERKRVALASKLRRKK